MFKKGCFFSLAMQSFWVRFGSIWFSVGMSFLGIFTAVQTMTEQERFGGGAIRSTVSTG